MDDISLLLYSTTIQQSVAYVNQLADQVNDLKKEEKELDVDSDRLKKDINDVNTGIERLKLKKTEGLQAKIYDLKIERWRRFSRLAR